jgi:hypothetical protein
MEHLAAALPVPMPMEEQKDLQLLVLDQRSLPLLLHLLLQLLDQHPTSI